VPFLTRKRDCCGGPARHTTIFLPLTVITAFFGMNFGWMIDRIGTATAFVLLGLVAPVLLTAAISLIIRRLTGPEL
jgi:Mg2+ and Co2+ transporter CorA